MKIFLGGTCNESTWRDELIPMLEIEYFNPVVEDWTPDCQAQEIQEREQCDIVLYTITPEMTGVYSIAEVVDDSNKRPKKTVFCVINNQNSDSSFNPLQSDQPCFTDGQMRSLKAVEAMVQDNGGKVLHDLRAVAEYANGLAA